MTHKHPHVSNHPRYGIDCNCSMGEITIVEESAGDLYHTVTIDDYGAWNARPIQLMGFSLGEPMSAVGPRIETRTGYERLRDWFWNKVHDQTKKHGYCDEECWC